MDLIVCMFVASGGWPELENENDKRVSCIWNSLLVKL